jgi:hypothetical protein
MTHLVPFYRASIAVVLAHLLPRASGVSSDISFRVAKAQTRGEPVFFIFTAYSGFLPVLNGPMDGYKEVIIHLKRKLLLNYTSRSY